MATSRGVGALATAAGLAITGCGESGHEENASGLSDATDVSCTQTIERSTSLNGPQLFSAAEACARAEQSDDAVFLVLAGQVRAMADMSLLEPQSEPDEEAMAELYGAVYYKYGGSGPDDMYRDVDRADRMFRRLRSWRPSFSDSYDPGWNYQPPAERERYLLMVDYSIRSRLAKLETYRNLVQDDRYYAIHKERREILARNNSRITPGTEDGDRIEELDQMEATIRSSIPRVPEPPLPDELQPDYSPNPDADFVQLHAGFNGIEEGIGLHVFDSRAEALDSWLSRVMAPADLRKLLDEVDFQLQTIVVLRFRPTASANGRLYIQDIEYRASQQSMNVSGVLGVNVNDCEEPKARSYPFVIAASPKPDFEVEVMSSSVSTLAEGCGPSVGAEGTSDPSVDIQTTTGETGAS